MRRGVNATSAAAKTVLSQLLIDQDYRGSIEQAGFSEHANKMDDRIDTGKRTSVVSRVFRTFGLG